MAPRRQPLTNPFAALSAGPILSARTVPKIRIACESEAVGRCEPGHSHGFAPSRAARLTAATGTLGGGLETKTLHFV